MRNDHKEMLDRIEAFEFDDPQSKTPFSERLARENNWSPDYTTRVIREYKRFTFLAAVAGHAVSPSEAVDEAWHLHMIYTESYWIRFCAEILHMPLHHHPSQGTPNDRSKLADWYARTLASYRKFFGSEPPADIWPAINQSSSGKPAFTRINLNHHWIIPKPRWVTRFPSLTQRFLDLKPASRFVLVALLLFCGAGCSTSIVAMVSPLDWKGPDFLKFYVVLSLASIGAATWLRWHLRRVDATLMKSDLPELDAYDVAYLSGKGKLAVDAAIATLVKNGALQLHTTDRSLHPGTAALESAHPMERAVYDAVDSPTGVSFREIRRTTREVVERIAERLKELHLILPDSRAQTAKLIPLFIALSVPIFGLLKIYVGLMREKPITYLAILCFISTVVALLGFARTPYRTSLADEVVDRLKAKHAALQTVPSHNSPSLDSALLPMAVGLFGLAVLENNDLADLRKRLGPDPGAGGVGFDFDGSSSSSGGSSCGGGGGCGGGGCGGCGGGD